jgi:hypothetical protein
MRMSRGVRFWDDFELDFVVGQLRRSGRLVKLERIPTDVLLFLVQQRGKIVSLSQPASLIQNFLMMSRGRYLGELNNYIDGTRTTANDTSSNADAHLRLGKSMCDPLCWFFWGRAGLRTSDVMCVLPKGGRRLSEHRIPVVQIVHTGAQGIRPPDKSACDCDPSSARVLW